MAIQKEALLRLAAQFQLLKMSPNGPQGAWYVLDTDICMSCAIAEPSKR